MPKVRKKKLPPITPGLDGLVVIEVVKPRLDREVGERYKVDPLRAKRLLELGLARPPKEKSDG